MQEGGLDLLKDYFEHHLKSYSPSVASRATRRGHKEPSICLKDTVFLQAEEFAQRA